MSSGTDSGADAGADAGAESASGSDTASSTVESRLGAAVQSYQGAVDDFDRELARLLGVNETDLRCLEILLTVEELTPAS